MEIRRQQQRGFALPTVLIASVVLMTVLAVSVSSVASVRITLKEQYYEQLAKVAGEAGVAYAKACLAKNGNVPLWTDAKPLTPATDCAGNITISPCPASTGCSVVSEQDFRSSFRVKRPTLDGNGKAVTIPNSGYVELLRRSNGAVWRTYTQPSVQPVVVPDLCSGAATTSQGWTNATRAAVQDTHTDLSSAVTLTPVTAAVSPGVSFFRKDFSVSADTANYTIRGRTLSASDAFDMYVDGVLRLSGDSTMRLSSNFALSAGCHTLEVRLKNNAVVSRQTSFTATLQRQGADAPLVVTDTSWRVSMGEVRHFSESGYQSEDSSYWSTVRDKGVYDTWVAGPGGDVFARFIAPSQHIDGSGNTPQGWLYLRDYKDVELSNNMEVRVSAMCDDTCIVYMDGRPILTQAPWSSVLQTTLTMTPGSHRFGIALYNQTGATGATLSVVRVTDGMPVTRTDARWQGASMLDTTRQDYYSYDINHTPSPTSVSTPKTVEAIIVAGGGGGGGNCASCGGAGGGGGGGVLLMKEVATIGSFAVTVGSGGVGGPAGSQTHGTSGATSTFGTRVAYGGGGGGAQNGLAGYSGGSGGGGSGGSSPLPGGGGSGTPGQGFYGGAGANLNDGNYNGGGGGGAAGPGVKGNFTPAGYGGAGVTMFFAGGLLTLGSGGGGGTYTTYAPGPADGGAGSGGGQTVNNGNGYPGLANTGGGGGGANGNNRGGAGGAGGSGIVIVRYKTGTVTATGGTITTWNGYTIHRFTANGTFTITALSD